MKLNKIALAAAMLVVGGTSAYAGQIDSSSPTLATEVISSNTITYRAPSKSYTFSGVVDATSNEQRLQVQWTLGGQSQGSAQWGGAAPAYTETVAPVTAPPTPGTLTNMLTVAWKDAAGATNYGWPIGTQIQSFLVGGNTLAFNVTVPQGSGNQMRDLVLTVNGDANATPGTFVKNAELKNLLSVAGATACVAPPQYLDIGFKHFTTHDGSTTLQAVASPDSEHVRAGNTSNGRLLNFVQDLRFNFVAEAGALIATTSSGLTQFQTGATTGAINATMVRIGEIDLAAVASGLDIDYIHQYGRVATSGVQIAAAADFTAPLIAVTDNGAIEASTLTVKIDANGGGFSAGSVVQLFTDNTCTTPVGPASAAATAGQASVTITLANPADYLEVANTATVCYTVTGTSVIPTAAFTATATLNKAAPGGGLAEQNNTCTGPLAGIGTRGAQIDVRNYASYATFGDNGPSSLLRIINNSEVKDADVWAQMIYADGTYGPYGVIGQLKPREAMNIANKALEALLTNSAPAAAPNNFVAGTQYTATLGTSVVASPKAGTGDRVRISTTTGETLRVQSYIQVAGQTLDTSNAQAVDLEMSQWTAIMNLLGVTRAGTPSQATEQDAINTIAK